MQRTSCDQYHVEKPVYSGIKVLPDIHNFELSLIYFFRYVLTFTLPQAVFQVAVLLTLNFRGRNLLHLTQDTVDHSSKVKNTVIFNTFVLCQVTIFG